jgi:hypothetical protein
MDRDELHSGCELWKFPASFGQSPASVPEVPSCRRLVEPGEPGALVGTDTELENWRTAAATSYPGGRSTSVKPTVIWMLSQALTDRG